MEIIIKPRALKSAEMWLNKLNSVILVEKEEDVEPLWKLLCEQDDYWEEYKNIIKIAPKEIESEREIVNMCEYCGKTDIDNIKSLQEKIPFIIFQNYSYDY